MVSSTHGLINSSKLSVIVYCLGSASESFSAGGIWVNQTLMIVASGWCIPGVHCSLLFSCSLVSICDPIDCSMPSFLVLHYLLELAQTHVHQIGDAIQPSHPLSSPFPPALNLSQHQGLFQWVGSLHQMANVLELQLQHQSFQQIFRVDFL